MDVAGVDVDIGGCICIAPPDEALLLAGGRQSISGEVRADNASPVVADEDAATDDRKSSHDDSAFCCCCCECDDEDWCGGDSIDID